ncbi:hypothetical protein SKAU_G00147000, partial [Synaphobranchus kaupii]
SQSRQCCDAFHVSLIEILRKGRLLLAELNYTAYSLEFSVADGLNNYIKLKMSKKDFMFAIISTFVVTFSIFTTNSEIPQVQATDAAYNSPASALDKERYAFYALRSCHRVLRGESGEFFSPDYLCSNPPLWCNWTIQAPPGRRVRLRLEDYTSAEACHLKQDQIHLDESPGSGRHRTLERCWQDAVYTSDSSTLYVVLLISGSMTPAYRGFHALYHTFGLPYTRPSSPTSPTSPTKAKDTNWGGEMEENLFAVREEEEPAMEQAQMDADQTLSGRPATDSPSLKGVSMTKSPLPERPLKTTPAERASSDAFPARPRVSVIQAGEAEDSGRTKEGGTQPKRDTEGTLKNVNSLLGDLDSPAEDDPSRETFADAEKEEDLVSVDPPDEGPVQKQPTVASPAPPITNSPPKVPSSTPHNSEFREEEEPGDDDASEPGFRNTRKLREHWDQDTGPGRPALNDDSDPPSGSVERQGTEIARGGGSVKPSERPPALEDSLREMADSFQLLRNGSGIASLPGENLFEVSVEVRLNPAANENWDNLVRLVMASVQTMIQDELRAHMVPKSISAIRIKRLSTGVLYIFWLHFAETQDSLQVHRFLHMALPRVQARTVNTRGRKDMASILFVSSEDVNECGTQLVLCDVNAECINRFGSYACRCKPGYEDKSRLGTGGTLCVAPSGTGPAQSLPPAPSPTLLSCLSGLCFLLGFFVILLLCIVGALYRRHHRGAFMLPCRSQENGGRDTAVTRNGSQLPLPPPPPVRRPRDGWGSPKDGCPSTDLPLLKFTPLTPSDDTQRAEQEEADKL